MKKYDWNVYAIEIYLNDVRRYIMKNIGVDAADRAMIPLLYWIRTGRASAADCKALVEKKPFVIGRYLMRSEGSVDSVLAGLKEKIYC